MGKIIDFAHLHVHSGFSFGDGVDLPEALCQAAAEAGQTALALTDTDGLYAAVPFVEAARAAGIRPILGAQVRGATGRAVLLPADDRALAGLFRLLTQRHAEGDGFDLVEALAAAPEGLAVLSDSPELLERLARRRGAEGLYVEVWPAGRDRPARRQRLLAFAAHAGMPAVATVGVHFARPEGGARHLTLRAAALGTPLESLPAGAAAPPEAWLWPAERVLRGFADRPEAVGNAAALAERCQARIPLGGLRPPRPPALPAEVTAALRTRAREALRQRAGRRASAPAEARLAQELDLLAVTGLSGAFLALADVAAQARQAGIPLALRGSAAGSLVLHLLGLSDVDPVAHDVPFSRFLAPGRPEPPDLDLEVGRDGRERLLALLRERFGADRCLRAGRFVPRAADPAGLPLRLAAHPSALVLLPAPADAVVPVQTVGGASAPVAQWSSPALRRSGLVLLDLLGNRALSVVHDLRATALAEGPPEDPLADPGTRTRVQTGATLGCYHLESPSARAQLRRIRPGQLLDVAVAIALVRPGAGSAGLAEAWSGRRSPGHGPGAPLVFQDDLLEACQARAGMGRGEVDALRQALHRGHGPAVPPGLQGELLARCAAHGTPEAEARSLWAQVLTFRGISYGKAHALVSARLGLACAWLREHRPADLLAALLAHGGGYYPRAAYLHEARRAGLGLLGPSVSESGLRWQGAGPAALRAGLRDVRGLTARAAEAIVAARQEGGTYRSEADLARRARLAPRDLDALHRAGALPGGEAAGAPERRRDRLRQELEGVGHLLSAHPLDLVADRLPAGLVRAQDLPGYAGAAVGVAGWLLTLKPVRDRAGRPMSFATFDDTTGLFDAVLQGQIHARHAPRLLGSPGPWLVCGRVALDPAAAAVRLDDLVEVAPDAQLCPSIRRFEDVRM